MQISLGKRRLGDGLLISTQAAAAAGYDPSRRFGELLWRVAAQPRSREY
jgi:hypothetical protein